MLSNIISNFFAFLCTLIMVLAPLESIAQPEQGSELTIAGSVLNFGYQEFSDTGKVLDREDGYIPGLVLGVSHTINRWLFAGDFSYHGGEVVYTGQTNTGIPISTVTRQNIVDLALRSEYWLQNSKGVEYALYLGAGYHQWNRDIRPTTANGAPVGGLFETYTWWSGFLGGKTAVYKSEHAQCLFDMRLLQIINPSIYVNFNGLYDNSRLALGERLAIKLSLPWRYAMNHSSSLLVEPFAESYELGRSATAPLTSNGTTVGSVFEPRSQTINYGLVVGLSQHF